MKPAEEAPLNPIRLGELALEAGLPPGALNIVPGFGEEAGAPLAARRYRSPRLHRPVEVGQLVSKAAADNVIPVTLELGGKSPNIVFDDADIESAVPIIVNSHPERGRPALRGPVLVDQSVQDQVVEAVAKRFGEIEIGPGLEDPDLGPIISKEQRERVDSYVQVGKQEADLLAGWRHPAGRAATGWLLLCTYPIQRGLARRQAGPGRGVRSRAGRVLLR